MTTMPVLSAFSMPSRQRQLSFSALALLLLLLPGCAGHPPVKTSEGPAVPTTMGSYKVGKPYQVGGVWYYPAEDFSYDESGIGSWYGPGFVGHATANGEPYDDNELTGAHKTLPMPSIVEVTNLENGRVVRVRINDRGPYFPGRVIDLSRRAAQLLGYDQKGTAKVRVKILAEESKAIAAAARARTGAIAMGGADGAAAASSLLSDDGSTPPMAAPRIAVQVEGQPAPATPAPAAPVNSTTESAGGALPGHVVSGRFMPDPVFTQGVASPGKQIYVQAGAFTVSENAQKMQSRLQSYGAVKISAYQTGGEHYYRVRIGPIATEDQADVVLGRLISAGINGAKVIVD